MTHEIQATGRRPRVRTAQLLARLLISAIAIVLCLGTLELIGVLWELSTAQGQYGWTLVASRRLELEPAGSVDRPYSLLRPNTRAIWEGIPVETNSQGFRDEEFSQIKPDGRYRILNLGDSIAFGWEVQQESTYGSQLEHLLNAQKNGLRYEVINTAVPGWSLLDERNFLLEQGLSYQPDLVLLDFTTVNDVGLSQSVEGKKTLFTWLRDHTHAWPFLTIQTRFLLSRYVGPEAIPVLNPLDDPKVYFPVDENDPVWEKVWAPIAEMAEKCKERGIDFVIVLFPTAFQINSSQHPDTPQKALNKRAAAAQIQLVDLTPIYKAACEDLGPRACDGYVNELFVDVWMHPTALGHRLAAEALFQKVLEHN